MVREEVEKVIPKAIRMLEFEKEQNNKKSLVLLEGVDILHYDREIPIAKYKCDEINNYIMKYPDFRLNAFINSVTVSNVFDGKRFSMNSGKIETNIIENEIVAYYENNKGIKRMINTHDIFKILIKKPNLVVSPEGVLIFYIDDKILATVDCEQYYWIDGHVINVDNKKVSNIEVCENYCKVTLSKKKKKEYVTEELKLKFNFDVTDHNMIKAKASKM